MSNVIDIFTKKPVKTQIRPNSQLKPEFDLMGPIEKKLRLSSSKETISSIEKINFDLSIYDKIAARFGDMQPISGVVGYFNTKQNTLEAYSRGCIANCSACSSMLNNLNNWNRPMPFPVNITSIHAKLSKSKGKTLRLGHNSDAFMWMDRKYGVAKATLKLANSYNVKLKIYTKSDLVATDDYIELLKGHIVIITMPIRGSEKMARALEPGVPSIGRRMHAIEKLKSQGVDVRVRLVDFKSINFKESKLSGLELKLNKLNVPFKTLEIKPNKEQAKRLTMVTGINFYT